jgi:hypothetical protein
LIGALHGGRIVVVWRRSARRVCQSARALATALALVLG